MDEHKGVKRPKAEFDKIRAQAEAPPVARNLDIPFHKKIDVPLILIGRS